MLKTTEQTIDYQPQLERIRQKLPLAKSADPKRKVFGASSHRYELGEPIDESRLQAFEQKYQISLPDDYRAFLLQITNGGKDGKHNQHAADWVDYLYQHLPQVNNKDDLSNGIWILETANDDYGELLIPLTQSPDVEIRKKAYDFLGLLCERKVKIKYINCLLKGKKDENATIRKMVSMKLKHLNKNLTAEKFNPFAWIKQFFSKE